MKNSPCNSFLAGGGLHGANKALLNIYGRKALGLNSYKSI
jgi:hypothetical protein